MKKLFKTSLPSLALATLLVTACKEHPQKIVVAAKDDTVISWKSVATKNPELRADQCIGEEAKFTPIYQHPDKKRDNAH